MRKNLVELEILICDYNNTTSYLASRAKLLSLGTRSVILAVEIIVSVMSRGSGIIPDEFMFNEFKRQCLSTENWLNKYNKNDMEVWVEGPPLSTSTSNKVNLSKVHKIKVRCLPTFSLTTMMCVYCVTIFCFDLSLKVMVSMLPFLINLNQWFQTLQQGPQPIVQGHIVPNKSHYKELYNPYNDLILLHHEMLNGSLVRHDLMVVMKM